MAGISVCAVPERQGSAFKLMMTLINAGHRYARIAMDYFGDGATLNHAQAWETALWSAERADYDWCGVLEDDALLDPYVAEQIDGWLASVPPEFDVVSAYLGTGVPGSKQPWIKYALVWLDGREGWLDSRVGPLSHVAVFIRRERVPEAVKALRAQPNVACDALLNAWCFNNRIRTAIPVPSWVDHADTGTTVKHAVDVSMPRKAWKVADGWENYGTIIPLNPNGH